MYILCKFFNHVLYSVSWMQFPGVSSSTVITHSHANSKVEIESVWEGTKENLLELETTLLDYNLDNLKKLIKNGAPYYHSTNDPYQHPLDQAAFYSRADIVEIIMERDSREKNQHSSELRAIFNDQMADALYRVCKSNYGPIARMLLQMDMQINNSLHPHEAAEHGSWVVLNEMYEHSKEPILDPRNDKGYTPLHCAASRGHIHTVRFLLERGSRIGERTKGEGLTALHLACSTAEEDTIQLLVTRGADVNGTDDRGRSPVFVAAENGRDNIISVLASAGANLDALDNEGNIPLVMACGKGHSKTVRELILNGASMEVTDRERYNGLERAIQNKQDSAAAVYIRLHQDREFLLYYLESMEINIIQIVKNGMQETIKALLDRMIVPDNSSRTCNGEVHVKYLDLDVDNKLPTCDSYSKSKNYLLQRISEIGDDSLAYHGTVRLVVDQKMIDFGYLILFLRAFSRLFFLSCLAYSLILAAEIPEPLDNYFTDGYHIFRLVCEVFVLLYYLVNLVTEAGEIIRIYLIARSHISDKQKQLLSEAKRNEMVGSVEEARNTYFKKCHDYLNSFVLIRVFYDYFRDKSNYLDVLGLFTLTVLIFLRVIRQPTQWVFATFAFLFNSLRMFKLIALIPVLGPYTTIIYKVLTQDFPRFIMLLLITLCIFTCTFFISLRVPYTAEGFVNSSRLQVNLREAGVDDRVWWVFLSGIRIVLDGDVYRDSNFLYLRLNWLAVTIYIAFFFLVVVVYLNVFIAQLSDTYADVKLNADRSFAWQRLNYIIQIQKSSMLSLCIDFRKLFFNKTVFVDHNKCKYYYHSCSLNMYLHNNQLEDLDLKNLLSSLQLQHRSRRKMEALVHPSAEDSFSVSNKQGTVNERLNSIENIVRQMSIKMDRILHK